MNCFIKRQLNLATEFGLVPRGCQGTTEYPIQRTLVAWAQWEHCAGEHRSVWVLRASILMTASLKSIYMAWCPLNIQTN